MKKLIVSIYCALLGISVTALADAGETPNPAVQSSTGPGGVPADPYLACIKQLAESPETAVIAKKLPLADFTHFSFAMLADESLPTTEERRELAYWFDARQKCWQDSEDLHKRELAPELFQLASEGFGEVTDVGTDLYNRKITFGEANKRLQKYRDAMLDKSTVVIRQYQANIAAQQAAEQQRQAAVQEQAARQQAYADAQQAREQQLRQQRAGLMLNWMRAMQPPPVQLPPPYQPPVTTNCSTFGSNTTCMTR